MQNSANHSNGHGRGEARLDQTDPYDEFERQALGETTFRGPFLKCKKGQWLTDGLPVPGEATYVAMIPKAFWTWENWQLGKLLERRLYPIGGPPRPARAALGSNDSAHWAIGRDGKAEDPWTLVAYLPLSDGATGVESLFSTQSVGGRRALGELVGGYGRLRRRNPGRLPIVKLGSKSMRTDNWGDVPAPVFTILGWAPWDVDEPAALTASQPAIAQQGGAGADADADPREVPPIEAYEADAEHAPF
jgi:hypothetical protein